MPSLVRFLLQHLVLGVATGWVVLAAFLALDVANLRTLIKGSNDGGLALVLLGVFFALTFGSAAMGLAVISDRKNGAPRDRPPLYRPMDDNDDRPL